MPLLTIRVALSQFRHHRFERAAVVLSSSFVLAACGSAFLLAVAVSSSLSRHRASLPVTAFVEPKLSEDRLPEIAARIDRTKGVSRVKAMNEDSVRETLVANYPEFSRSIESVEPDLVPRFVQFQVQSKNRTAALSAIQKIPGVESLETHENRHSANIRALEQLRTASLVFLAGLTSAFLCLWFGHARFTMQKRSQARSAYRLLGAGAVKSSAPFVLEGGLEGFVSGLGGALLLIMAARSGGSSIFGAFSQMGVEFSSAWHWPLVVLVVGAGTLSGFFGGLWTTLRSRNC
jgi:cell division protein FtsX